MAEETKEDDGVVSNTVIYPHDEPPNDPHAYLSSFLNRTPSSRSNNSTINPLTGEPYFTGEGLYPVTTAKGMDEEPREEPPITSIPPSPDEEEEAAYRNLQEETIGEAFSRMLLWLYEIRRTKNLQLEEDGAGGYLFNKRTSLSLPSNEEEKFYNDIRAGLFPGITEFSEYAGEKLSLEQLKISLQNILGVTPEQIHAIEDNYIKIERNSVIGNVKRPIGSGLLRAHDLASYFNRFLAKFESSYVTFITTETLHGQRRYDEWSRGGARRPLYVYDPRYNDSENMYHFILPSSVDPLSTVSVFKYLTADNESDLYYPIKSMPYIQEIESDNSLVRYRPTELTSGQYWNMLGRIFYENILIELILKRRALKNCTGFIVFYISNERTSTLKAVFKENYPESFLDEQQFNELERLFLYTYRSALLDSLPSAIRNSINDWWSKPFSIIRKDGRLTEINHRVALIKSLAAVAAFNGLQQVDAEEDPIINSLRQNLGRTSTIDPSSTFEFYTTRENLVKAYVRKQSKNKDGRYAAIGVLRSLIEKGQISIQPTDIPINVIVVAAEAGGITKQELTTAQNQLFNELERMQIEKSEATFGSTDSKLSYLTSSLLFLNPIDVKDPLITGIDKFDVNLPYALFPFFPDKVSPVDLTGHNTLKVDYSPQDTRYDFRKLTLPMSASRMESSDLGEWLSTNFWRLQPVSNTGGYHVIITVSVNILKQLGFSKKRFELEKLSVKVQLLLPSVNTLLSPSVKSGISSNLSNLNRKANRDPNAAFKNYETIILPKYSIEIGKRVPGYKSLTKRRTGFFTGESKNSYRRTFKKGVYDLMRATGAGFTTADALAELPYIFDLAHDTKVPDRVVYERMKDWVERYVTDKSMPRDKSLFIGATPSTRRADLQRIIAEAIRMVRPEALPSRKEDMAASLRRVLFSPKQVKGDNLYKELDRIRTTYPNVITQNPTVRNAMAKVTPPPKRGFFARTFGGRNTDYNATIQSAAQSVLQSLEQLEPASAPPVPVQIEAPVTAGAKPTPSTSVPLAPARPAEQPFTRTVYRIYNSLVAGASGPPPSYVEVIEQLGKEPEFKPVNVSMLRAENIDPSAVQDISASEFEARFGQHGGGNRKTARHSRRMVRRTRKQKQRGGAATSMPLAWYQQGAQFQGTVADPTGVGLAGSSAAWARSALPAQGGGRRRGSRKAGRQQGGFHDQRSGVTDHLEQMGGFSPSVMGAGFASVGLRLLPAAAYMGYNQYNNYRKQQRRTRRRK